jgi:hypothetical protein
VTKVVRVFFGDIHGIAIIGFTAGVQVIGGFDFRDGYGLDRGIVATAGHKVCSRQYGEKASA